MSINIVAGFLMALMTAGILLWFLGRLSRSV